MLPLRAKLSAARYLIKLVMGNPAKKNQISLEDMTAGCKSEETLEILRVISGIGIIAPEPRFASAGELAAYLKKALRSKVKVGYPKGGTPSIIEGLREELEKNGQIMTGSKVNAADAEEGPGEPGEDGNRHLFRLRRGQRASRAAASPTSSAAKTCP